ncbi:MAG TPA: shikimate dehydrogenase [Acidimicrobiia bacterium]|nr:shikimate dehydrogenase [Acidimicrobiia bacterium]
MSEPSSDAAAISGRTRVAGVIGAPVAHSLSPAIHNAAYRALGLDWVYVGLPVAEGRGRAAVRALATLGLAGVNVTMPHKAAAAEACDTLTVDAAALSAVNTVVVADDGTLAGENTDGAGFLAMLESVGVGASDRRVLVLGAGGAARAIVLALGRVGARVTVAARRPAAAAAAAALASGAQSFGWDDLATRFESAEIVVNATPIGMGSEPPPVEPEAIGAGQVVVDTVYHPAETPLLAVARARGARCAGGVGMLVGQAAVAFELLTGHVAPVEVMTRAAQAALADRAG